MFIKEVELFKGIAPHIIEEIADIAGEEIFPAGHVLFKRGDSADSIYLLVEGKIEITIEGQESISFRSQESGYVFGWSALIEPNRYTATAVSVDESKVVKIDGGRLMRIFDKHPSESLTVMKRLAGVIAARLVNCYQEVTASKIEWKAMT